MIATVAAAFEWLAYLLLTPIFIGAVFERNNCGCCCQRACFCECCGPEGADCPPAPQQIIVTITGVTPPPVGDGLDSARPCDCEFGSVCECPSCDSFNGTFVCEFMDVRNDLSIENDCIWIGPDTYFCSRCDDTPVATGIIVEAGIPSTKYDGETCGSLDGTAYSCGYRVWFNAGNETKWHSDVGGVSCLGSRDMVQQDIVGTLWFFYDPVSTLPDEVCIEEYGTCHWYWFQETLPNIGDCCLVTDDATGGGGENAFGGICPEDVLIEISLQPVGATSGPCINCDELDTPDAEDCAC